MIRRTARRYGLWWVAAVLMLAACGGESDDTPLPTVFNRDELQTPPAPTATSITPSPDALPIAQGASPTAPPVAPTDTPSPTTTPSATPTVLTAGQIEATQIAQTATGAAGVLPFTQTV